ncbi:MAG: hypothetical protein QOJ03_780 [Frankiaceae bacterium]|nr:hypothetical protein [Frankiaceae bacterium]
MTVRTRRLRRLDDSWLPRSARLARRLGRWTRGPANGRRRAAAQGVVLATATEPALVGSIVAVLVAGLLIAVLGGDRGSAEQSDRVTPLPSSPPALLATIGPAPGASVASYLSRAAYELRHYGQIAAGRAAYAVVDLRTYETPAEATKIFTGLKVVRAYVRVPSGLPTEVRSVPVNGLDDLSIGIGTAAQVATATARSYAALLASFHPRSRADRLTRARYAKQRRAALFEAARLARPTRCRCVFAMVVLADIKQLESLSRMSAVRVVDPASPVISLSGLTIRPLEPQVTTIVPRTGLLGG